MESESNNICKITNRFEVDTTDISDSQNKLSNISNCNEVESAPHHIDITNVSEVDKSPNNKLNDTMIDENNSENLTTDNKPENLSHCNKINVDNVLTMPNQEVQEQYHKSNDKVNDVSEIPVNNKNSIVSFPTNTLQDNGTISSNDNEASPSPSDQNKIKRSISKGQISGESDMSMEKSGNSSDEDSSKRQKLNDNSCDKTTTEAESQAGSIPKFHKLKSEIKKRNYRNRKNFACDTGNNSNEVIADEPMPEVEEVNSDNVSDHNTPNAMVTNSSARDTDDCERNVEINSDGPDQDGEREGRNFVGEDDSNEWTTASEDELEDTPLCLKKEKPKPNWSMVPEIVNREIGINPLFQRRFYGSVHAVERLELMYKLNEHQGCVNALNFNQKGNLLASGSDDLIVVIWDWATGKKHHSFNSGHRSNMFQCKWLPFDVEYLMATCARDGQVRLLDLVRGISRKLAAHHAPSHKLAVHPDTPHVIISVGEDARVFSIDIRENNPTKLLVVKDGTSDVLLYSVHSNPLNSNEFCVGGRSQSVRIYDRRKVSTPVHKLCPERLQSTTKYAYVTCAVYNYNGTEVLASYSNEDIYLFDTVTPQPGDFAHRYQGHRNIATVKGVNFFGPKSEYILSGSDCGNIFIWDKNTEAIVQWMQGDEQGVVNCLEPHPHIPILATSGLDYDVKIWVPSCGRPPTMEYLENCVKTNINYPERGSASDPDIFDEQMLWILLRHMSYTERNFHTNRGSQDRNNDDDDDDADDSLSDNDSSDHSDSQSEGEPIGRLPCPPS